MSNDTIHFVLYQEFETIVRIRDVLLYRALRQRLGDRITSDIQYRAGTDRRYWGMDPHGENRRSLGVLQAAYRHPHLHEALGGAVICGSSHVQAEMDRLSRDGLGSTIRNLAHPTQKLRHLEPGSSWTTSETHVLGHAPCRDAELLVHPHMDGGWRRRFLVAGGVIACDTPYSFSGWEDGDAPDVPLSIPAGEIAGWHAPDWMKALTQVPPFPGARDMQIAAAQALLDGFDLPSGAIDVELTRDPCGDWRAHVVDIEVAPPGGFDLFWAPVEVYADVVAEKIAVIEPDMELLAAHPG